MELENSKNVNGEILKFSTAIVVDAHSFTLGDHYRVTLGISDVELSFYMTLTLNAIIGLVPFSAIGLKQGLFISHYLLEN